MANPEIQETLRTTSRTKTNKAKHRQL